MKNTDLTPIQQARADLEAKKAAVKALEAEMDAIRGAIRYMEGVYGVSADPAVVSDNNDLVGSEVSEVPSTKEATVSAYCEGYVNKAGPATGAELYLGVTTLLGFKLSGKDRNAQMATMAGYLTRVKKLRYYKEHGRWWFTDRPYPVKRQGFFS
jgi:hypothetical protein